MALPRTYGTSALPGLVAEICEVNRRIKKATVKLTFATTFATASKIARRIGKLKQARENLQEAIYQDELVF